MKKSGKGGKGEQMYTKNVRKNSFLNLKFIELIRISFEV